MKKKKSKVAAADLPTRESWEIWNHLVKNAGFDTVYYDEEFLNGNSSFNGLSQYLGFKVDKTNVVERLKKHKVSAEKFIGAFFNVLQPYAQMMNELCVFFSNHKVKETNECLQIVFDFGNMTDQLDFNIENFRSVLTSYTKIKKKVTYYHVPNIWGLHHIFRYESRVNKHQIADRKAVAWLEAYENGKYLKPELSMPETGYKGLDLQLQRVLDLWADYVNTCRSYDENIRDFINKFYNRKSESKGYDQHTEQITDSIDLTLGWGSDNLRAELDRWSATMIELLFGDVEYLNKMTGKDRDHSAAVLEASLQSYFEGLPKSEAEIEDVVTELTELLNLPIWKKRYELFSTWILSALDQALADYDRVVHDQNGVLILSFSSTHLMTVQSADGPFEVWAENRTLAVNPTGHGRKRGIQPDYTIYQPTVGDPNDCIVCVEVKQYKKASIRNFGNAINDYANGLPKAHIFLVNYGPVPTSLTLDHPARSRFFGGVQPSSTTLSTFDAELLSALPPTKPLTPEEILKASLINLSIDTLFVDVSGSMDGIIPREYIRAFLRNVLQHKKVDAMIALDETHLKRWVKPGQNEVEDLLASHFYGGDDFAVRFLAGGNQNLIITDRTGALDVWESGYRPIVIMLENQNAELWTYVKEEDTYIKQATEPIEVSIDHKEKGFEGWVFAATNKAI